MDSISVMRSSEPAASCAQATPHLLSDQQNLLSSPDPRRSQPCSDLLEPRTLLIRLLRSGMAAVPDRRPFEEPLTDAQWTEICRLAGKHSVLGLLARAVDALPRELEPPLGIRSRLSFRAEQIASRNAVMNAHTTEITSTFAQMGLRTCLLKGQGTAALYADPASRQSGDIDIWICGALTSSSCVTPAAGCEAPAARSHPASGREANFAVCSAAGREADATLCPVACREADVAVCPTTGREADAALCPVACREADAAVCPAADTPAVTLRHASRAEILRVLESRWSHGKVFYHHTDIRPFDDGTEVEVHFTPTWLNDPISNHRLQQYFRHFAASVPASASESASASALASASESASASALTSASESTSVSALASASESASASAPASASESASASAPAVVSVGPTSVSPATVSTSIVSDEEPALTSLYPAPSTTFNLVFNAVHIYRHLLSEGVGLRQIIDYVHIIRSAASQNLQEAYSVLKQLRMSRFCGALMYVEQQLFLLDDAHLLCQPDPELGHFLMEEIFISGNFGRGDTRYHYDPSASLPERTVSRLTRLAHFLSTAPSEVLWAPAFKIWQHLRFR